MITIAPFEKSTDVLVEATTLTSLGSHSKPSPFDVTPAWQLKQKALIVFMCMLPTLASAQEPLVAGANINMVSGVEFPGGDPFLQRQNEPSLAVSTRNPLHLLAGANDYRTVDIPGLTDGKAVGDSWPGVFTSVNGGGSWVSTLIPGFPQDNTATGLASPLKGFEAGADPVIRAGTNGLFYYAGIVFKRGDGAPSAAFVSRFMDLNNDPRVVKSFEESPVRYIDTQIVDSDPGEANSSDSKGFIDKPWLAVDIPRSNSQRVTLQVPQEGRMVEQTVDCGPLYMAYAQITGEDTRDIDSHIMFSSSTDCGGSWSSPKELDGDDRAINQGTSVAINPNNGDIFVSWRQFNQATLQCTRGGDFWETNTGEWPVERFMLGGVLYDQQQALQIMAGSQNGNPWRLAREMIVAKLNLLSGLNDKGLSNLVDQADAWLIDAQWVYEGSGNGTNNSKDKPNNGKGNGNAKGSAADKEKTNSSLASELAGQIELFNDGVDGPGDCATFPSGQGQTDKPDAIMLAYSKDFGATFTGPIEVSKLVPFDQGTTLYTFRNNSYPTMAVDDIGRVYIAWSTRNRTGEPGEPEWVDSRIVIASADSADLANLANLANSATNTNSWIPQAMDYDFSSPFRGHQIQPSLAFSNGKLMLVYLDFRQDRSAIFERYIADVPTDPPTYRHTVDVRVAIADPASNPKFTDYSILNSDGSPSNPSTQLSRYFNLMLQYDDAAPASREQLQFNPLNQPLFKGGTVPFIGDYIDLAPSPSFIPNGDGSWSYNTSSDDSPVFHAAWADNRDVRGPPDGDWTKYVPPNSSGGTSIFDPTQSVQACVAGVNDEYTGMRNQNIYTSRITQGLFVGIPANAKPLLADVPRSFVLFAKYSKNTLEREEPAGRTFTLRIVNQPEGGMAAFNQAAFSTTLPEAPITEIEVTIGRNSSTAKTIYATSSTNPSARIAVEVVSGNLRGTALINPDPINPGPVFDQEEYEATVKNSSTYFEENLFDTRLFESLENGTLQLDNILDLADSNPDTNLLTQSLAQLSLTNPDLFNPGIYNPGIYNPGIYNPGIYNPGIYNPGIYNPGIYNPGIYNPGIYNPGIYNPGIYNPGIYNGTITDVTYTVENTGDTSSAYDVNIALDEIPVDENGQPLYSYQLIVSRFSTTPVPQACDIIETPVQEVLVNNNDPELLRRLLDPNSEDSFYLNPGETAVVTLRIIPNVADANAPPPPPPNVDEISIAVVETSVDEEDFVVGDTQPDVTVVLSESIAPLAIPSQTLAAAQGGLDYSAQLVATGGAGPKTWTVVPGTLLPKGLELTAGGNLFGVPLEGGTFTIAARVTDDTAIVQSAFAITVSAPPDLVVSNLIQSPLSPTDQDIVTVTATVSNLGAEPALASILQFVISGEATLDATSDSRPVPSIAGGASVNVEIHYTPSLSAQDYTVTATADSAETVVESDETNNSNTDGFTVTPSVSAVQITATERIFNFDFTALSPSPPFTNIRFGATFSTSDPVTVNTDTVITRKYGGLNGTELVQTRNDSAPGFSYDTSFKNGGTVYGPFTTANPIFDPMLDGIFSISLQATTGSAELISIFACGLLNGAFGAVGPCITLDYTSGIDTPVTAAVGVYRDVPGLSGSAAAWDALQGPLSVAPPNTAPFACGPYQPLGIAADRAFCWIFQPAESGSYALTLDGLSKNQVVDAGAPMPLAVITNVSVGSGDTMLINWTASAEHESFLVRVWNGGIFSEKLVAANGGSSYSQTLSVPALASGVGYLTNVFALNADLTTSAPLPTQFNISASNGNTLQLSVPFGGGGGEPFALVCPDNHVATGLAGRAGDDIDRTELRCRPIISQSPASLGAEVSGNAIGGFGGADYGGALTCGENSVLTGVQVAQGNSFAWIDVLGSRCSTFAGSISNVGLVGNSVGTPITNLDCPAGMKVTGIRGGQGALLDRIQLVCTAINLQP